MSGANLYVHFPFCRRKCTYCVLHSRSGVREAERDAYVRSLAATVRSWPSERRFETVYFGGGTPALGDLRPLLEALAPRLKGEAEFTVELHPLDVTDRLLARLAGGGVNRVSMGLESLDDATLADMGRGYTLAEAERAFAAVKRRFANAGVDLIVGYPGDPTDAAAVARLGDWGLEHCSVYSLQLEEGSILAHRLKTASAGALPPDEAVMDRLAEVAEALKAMGLERYEISNYARRGCECRHNLAVWRGEDYFGLGEGAAGRMGLRRTLGGETVETVDPERDRRERALFRLRTREGISAGAFPEWTMALERFVAEGLLRRSGDALYTLTPRGAEVCDTILSELV